MPPLPFADLAGAERAVAEGLAALLQRARTGRGCYREVALAAVLDELAEPLRQGLSAPGGVLGGGLPAYRIYRAADGWVALAALEPHFRDRVRALLGTVDDAEELGRVLATRTAREWEAWAEEHDLPLVALPVDQSRSMPE
jgi:crotonobetainyl-CoA:carnitine CoA-transferase CaiB-like acyl-CoA transferase